MKSILRRLSSLRLGLKLMIPIIVVLLLAAVFIIAIVSSQNRQMYREREDRALRFTDVSLSITESELIQNRPDRLPEIFQTLKRRGGVDRIRLLGLKGQVMISTEPGERGLKVNRNAAGCIQCHAPGKEPAEITKPFARFVREEKGIRILGVAYPLLNRPSCQGKDCHPSASEIPALGVLEVELSLEGMDHTVRQRTLEIFLSAGIALVLIVGVIVGFAHWGVSRPLHGLLQGIRRVRSGELGTDIPVVFDDEIGRLTASFNGMMADIRGARSETQERSETLEKKIEELKNTQMQLVRSEKLASLGKLSAGIAHEINNPLATVLTYCYILKRRNPDKPELTEKLETMILEITRCSQIVKGLLDFAREDEPVKKAVDLNRVLGETLDLISNQSIFHNIDIHRILSEDLPTVMADASQIKQVFMNIVFNAAEAMPLGGTLRMETRANGRFAEAVFRDTGTGIAPENMTRIFDPFFSSKKTGHGTGLGLAVSFSIIERHGGEIEVNSEPGEGTEFVVRLPV